MDKDAEVLDLPEEDEEDLGGNFKMI